MIVTIYLVCDLTTHVREVSPAVTSGVASLHVWASMLLNVHSFVKFTN